MGEAEQLPRADEELVAIHRRHWALRLFKWLGVAALALVALAALAIAMLNTDQGRRFAANQISGLEFSNGLRFGVQRIDGSLYGKLTLHGVSLSDTKGVFFRAPVVKLDWRPFAYVGNHVDVRSLTAPTVALLRVPEFHAAPPSKGPLLPDIDITVGRLSVQRLVIEPAVTGERRIGSIEGRAMIADGRAQIELNAGAIAGRNRPGGDRLRLALDAVPGQNRLAVKLLLDAPGDGVLAKLAGISDTVDLRVQGRGDWSKWDGVVRANLGGEGFARLALKARDGTFAVNGPVRLSRLFSGPTAGLLGPVTSLSLQSTWHQRVARFNAEIHSDAFKLGSSGTADLSRSRLRDVRLRFALLRPTAIAPNLAGQNVRVELLLNGSMRRPRVDYQLQAERIAFGSVAVAGLDARGMARFAKDHVRVPVIARAVAISGLDVAAGGTVRNVGLTGDLAIDWPRILSDNLRLRSDRIDATAMILANASSGLYSAALDGTITNYRIASVGIFNISSDADLKSTAKGLALAGQVRARSTLLFNQGVREFLGGNFVASSAVRYGADGFIRFSNLRLKAPLLRVTEGRGTYAPNGQIAARAVGVSKKYGPIRLDLAGTASRPRAVVTASRPGLGLGLANLRAEVRSVGSGYELRAKGRTDYGALKADVLLHTGRGPMTIEIRRGELAGINFEGIVRQGSAGPFTGELVASGRGINGRVLLSAAGRFQRAHAVFQARNAVLPAPARIAVGFADIDADVILTPKPSIKAEVQLTEARAGDTRISALRALVDYRQGAGSAKLIAEGHAGVPFRVALNGDLQPDLWTVALRGRANGIDFRTHGPARIVPKSNAYELMPARIALDDGSMLLAGRYGDGLQVQARLNNVSLALADSFAPGLGVGGRVSGKLDFNQPKGTFPRASAELALRNFTRTTAAAVSQPIDVNLVAELQPAKASVRAVMRTRGTVIGRLQAFAEPLGPGRSWTDRISGAPVTGGIRYVGPADSLFSFAGLADQSLTGSLGVAADFGCRVASPCLRGVVRGRNLTYTNSTYGTHLSNMTLSGRFNGERLDIQQLAAQAGNGRVTGSGYISLAAARGYPANISLRLDQARLAASDDLNVVASGDLKLIKAANQAAILSGTVRLPSTRYRFVREGVAQVPQLTGVRFKSRGEAPRVTGDAEAAPAASYGDVQLDLRVIAPNQLFVSGMGLESEWRADLRLSGASANPRIAGTIDLIRGTLGFAGRSFKLTDGRIRFLGGGTGNATIALSGTETVEDVDVTLNVSGSVNDPRVSFSSTPGLPQDEIMARVLFGNSVGSLSALQAVQLAASLNALRGSGGGFSPLAKLRAATGIDRLRILGADEASGRGAALGVGKYVTNDIYLEIVTDARGFTATQLEVTLSQALSILSRAGGSGGMSVSVRYRKRY